MPDNNQTKSPFLFVTAEARIHYISALSDTYSEIAESCDEIADKIIAVESIEIDESYGGLQAEAQKAKNESIAKLEKKLTEAVVNESEGECECQCHQYRNLYFTMSAKNRLLRRRVAERNGRITRLERELKEKE